MNTSFSSDRMEWSPTQEETVNPNSNPNTSQSLRSVPIQAPLRLPLEPIPHNAARQAAPKPRLHEEGVFCAPRSSSYPTNRRLAIPVSVQSRFKVDTVSSEKQGFTPLRSRQGITNETIAAREKALFTGARGTASPVKRTHDEFSRDLDIFPTMAASISTSLPAVPGAWPGQSDDTTFDLHLKIPDLVVRSSHTLHTLHVHATKYAGWAHDHMLPCYKGIKSGTIQTYRGVMQVGMSCKRRLVEVTALVYEKLRSGLVIRAIRPRTPRQQRSTQRLDPSIQNTETENQTRQETVTALQLTLRGDQGTDSHTSDSSNGPNASLRKRGIGNLKATTRDAEETSSHENANGDLARVAMADTAEQEVTPIKAEAEGLQPGASTTKYTFFGRPVPDDPAKQLLYAQYLKQHNQHPEIVQEILQKLKSQEPSSDVLTYLRSHKEKAKKGPSWSRDRLHGVQVPPKFKTPIIKRQRFYQNPLNGGPVSQVRYFSNPKLHFIPSSPPASISSSDSSSLSPPLSNDKPGPSTPSSLRDEESLSTLSPLSDKSPPLPREDRPDASPPRLISQGEVSRDKLPAAVLQQDLKIEADVSTPQLFINQKSATSSLLESAVGRLELSPARKSSRLKAKQAAKEKERKLAEDRLIAEQLAKEQEAFWQRLAEEKAERARLENEEKIRRGNRATPKGAMVKPLTAEWEKKVQEAMAMPMTHELATSSNGTKITRKDFGTLLPWSNADASHGWLNDEIIAASMQHIIDHAREKSGHQQGQTPKYHAFNSFFYTNLRDKGPESVKRWATRAKIGGSKLKDVDMVFVPVHQGAHWTLMVISPKAKRIEYFDSFSGEPSRFLKDAKVWLRQELGSSFIESEWTARAGVSPRQFNGSDCGVFLLTTAKMIMLGWDPEKAYSSKDMATQRKRIAAELMNGGFVGDFAPATPSGRWD